MLKTKQEEKKDQGNSERKPGNKNEVFFANAFVNTVFPKVQATRHVSGPIVIQKPVDITYSLLRPPTAPDTFGLLIIHAGSMRQIMLFPFEPVIAIRIYFNKF